MDDQYRMIEQSIETLLDENQNVVTLVPMDDAPVTMKPKNFLPYKCLEIAAKEGPITVIEQSGPISGQYTKWSTVESDELNVQQYPVEQPLLAPMLPAYINNLNNLTAVQNLILNMWNAQLRQNMTGTKRTCSFCKKNGMSFATYTSHSLRVNNILQCPYLLKCQCSYCFKNGHTTSYCPMKERTAASIASSFFDRSAVNRY